MRSKRIFLRFSKVEVKKVEQIGMKMLKYVYDGSCSLKNLPEAEYRRNIETHFGLLLCKTSGLYALRSVVVTPLG